MSTTFDFTFSQNKTKILELPFTEHLEELKHRFLHILTINLVITFFCFLEAKFLVKLLEVPSASIKFFQLSPSEYFISTVKLSFYTGVVFGSPFAITQIILFLLPGLTKKETAVILPLLISSVVLFSLGLIFAYFILIPTALKFFINYSADVLEPFWSFDQYFEFILVIFFSTGLTFQIPIIQILLGLLNIITVTQMLNFWRYIIFFSTIVGAILTPSTDPLTQLLLSFAILILYFLGVGILLLIKN